MVGKRGVDLISTRDGRAINPELVNMTVLRKDAGDTKISPIGVVAVMMSAAYFDLPRGSLTQKIIMTYCRSLLKTNIPAMPHPVSFAALRELLLSAHTDDLVHRLWVVRQYLKNRKKQEAAMCARWRKDGTAALVRHCTRESWGGILSAAADRNKKRTARPARRIPTRPKKRLL